MSWQKAGIILGLVVCLGGGYVLTDWYTTIPASSPARYVGRDSCIRCHQQQADLFHGSHHDLAMDLATAQTVLGDFNDQTLSAFGVESRFFKQDERFMVRTEGPDGKLQDFEVKYVFGVEPLQQYMVEFDRPEGMPANEISRVQVLSLCWDTRKKRWFHLQPPDVSEKVEPGDPLHWTGRTQCWNTSCADCHSTNLQKNFDLKSLQYHTTFSEIDVSCEACHGPGSHHVDMAESWSLFWDRKQGYGLAQLKGEDSKNQIETCAKCHSRRGEIHEGFCGGQAFHDFYSNELLSEQTYHDDGQIKDEVYVYGSFLQSKMYHQGIRCTDCHDPHSTKVKFDTNELCTSCHAHPAGKYDTPSHHRHQAGSTGSRCVDCHMPETTYMAVDPRRDHSLRIPRPDLSVQLGTPNACTQCHLDPSRLPPAEQKLVAGKQYLDWMNLAKSYPAIQQELARLDQWAQKNVLEWYGPDKQVPHYAQPLHRIRQDASDLEAYEKLRQLVYDRNTADIVRATAAMELSRNPEAMQLVVSRAFLGAEKELRSPALKQLDDETSPMVINGLLQTVELEVVTIVNAARDANDQVSYEALVVPLKHYVDALVGLHDHALRMVRLEATRVLLHVPRPVTERILNQSQLALIEKVFGELIESMENGQERGHVLRALGSTYEMRADVTPQERFRAESARVQASDRYFELARQAYRDSIRVAPGESGARGNLAAMNDRLVQQLRMEASLLQRQVQDGTLSASGAEGKLKQIDERIGQIQQETATLRKQELQVLGVEAERARSSNVGAEVVFRYALALYLDGQMDQCEQQLGFAVDLAPEDIRIRQSYTEVLEKQGKFREALESVDKLLRLAPKNSTYQTMRNNLRQKVN